VLEVLNGRARIKVSDFGIGFDVAALAESPADAQTAKFGLFSIRERMKALGGTFDIRSAPGQGTEATLSLPVGIETVSDGKPKNADLRLTATEAEKPAAGLVPPSPQRSLHETHAKVRLLLVDDHAMMREGLRTVLESYDDVEIVGEASNGEDALALVEQLRPSLVVMDINMPGMNGIDATEQITKTYPDILVIGLSVNATDNNVQAMLKAGAVFLLTKEAAVNELHRRMREVLMVHVESGSVAR
jgi:CheY-like chemotaxis protein